MDTKSNELESLKKVTETSIEKKKVYDFEIPKGLSRITNYAEKYLNRTINGNFIQQEKDSKGRPVKFNAAPVYNKNILLAMAFYKAEKLVSELYKGENKQRAVPFTEQEITRAGENTSTSPTPISPLEGAALLKDLLGGKNKSLIKSLKKGEMEQLNTFAQKFNVVIKALKELRNFHAHILHEPGPIKLQNIYTGSSLNPKNKLSQHEWDTACTWFETKWNDVQQHLIKSVTDNNKLDATEDDKENRQNVLTTIKGYSFKDKEGYLTPEALLFIACMFLRKSDAAYFVKKWTGLKRAKGVFKTSQTFFTYYALRDAKSLTTQNADLLKFRKITGILSACPEFKNNCFAPFNAFIKQHNEHYGKQAEEAKEKQAKEAARNHCIPLRKNFSPTYWYLDYLKGKGLLAAFEIAYYKTEAERAKYLEDNNITSGVLNLKIRMKSATGDEKRRLTAIYKEAKRNFVFKNNTHTGDYYCVKNQSAIFKYTFKDTANSGKEVTVQVAMPCDLLMKWAFASILWGTDAETQAASKITSFITNHYISLIHNTYNHLPLPPSLNPAKKAKEYTAKDARKMITEKLKQLEQFQKNNLAKKAPWKYEAKRKMDIIFDYVRLSYTKQALKDRKDINARRHEALNDLEYLDALDFIRFYGKNYVLSEFKQFFFTDKKTYFAGIASCLQQAKTLEELYTAVYARLHLFYVDIQTQLTGKDKEIAFAKCKQLFSLKAFRQKSDKTELAKRFAVNQIVPYTVIDIKELAEKNNKEQYNAWKANVKDTNRTTDFSLMRYLLNKRNKNIITNTDYLMQVVWPQVHKLTVKEGGMPKNKDGKLQGTTSLFNTLMKNKTDELMMWEVAKTYWRNTYNKDYNVPNQTAIEKDKLISQYPYKTTLFFFKVFNELLMVPLKDKDKTIYNISIRPKKFDDEFQYYETDNIITYIKQYKPVAKSTKAESNKDITYYEYEPLNKDLKNVIAGYLDDVYLLLTVEKKVVQANYDYLTSILHQAAEKTEWEGYQFTFGSNKKNKKGEPDNANANKLAEMIVTAINNNGGNITVAELTDFRNKVMHQQIQPNKAQYEAIRKALLRYVTA